MYKHASGAGVCSNVLAYTCAKIMLEHLRNTLLGWAGERDRGRDDDDDDDDDLHVSNPKIRCVYRPNCE